MPGVGPPDSAGPRVALPALSLEPHGPSVGDRWAKCRHRTPVAKSGPPSANDKVIDPVTEELERISTEADDPARHLRPDPITLSTLKTDLGKVRRHVDSVDDARLRTRRYSNTMTRREPVIPPRPA
jgi:hypothetical protein